MLADELDFVIGVDTHRDEHVLVVVSASGAVLAQRVVRAESSGYRSALAFAERFAAGRRVWAIEGAGSYGAGLARMMVERGEAVLEAGRPARAQRRSRGKDDALDALLAARGLLASEAGTVPRDGGRREALRLLLITRRSAVDARRHALVQMRAVIVTCPDALREQLRRLPTTRLLGRCSRLRRRAAAPPEELAARLTLRMLARRAQAATAEANELEREIVGHVRVLAPALLDEPGVGAIVAAQLLVAWSHHGRLRSEAAFARLAGVAPLPASSGQTVRYRLSRGGDRQLNRALHTIVLHRRHHDPATIDYIARRIAEGKSRREATRLLKRYVARHLYRLLEQQPLMT
jgi:transposase